jgi:toxin ParE1/3/4
MATKIVLKPAAEKDIYESVEWYEEQQEKLGQRFLFELDFIFSQITSSPHLFPIVFKKFRRAVMLSFPFCVYFAVENEIIIILAVHHSKRSPLTWKKRK